MSKSADSHVFHSFAISAHYRRCTDMKVHTASVSAVKADQGGSIAVSAGYDGLVCVWDTVAHPCRALKSTLKVAFSLSLERIESTLMLPAS